MSEIPKISVIIPVYNTEEYLEKCLDSVLNQSYENLEILIVDDGSTDSSGMICDEYAQKDCRIKVIHKTNGGQGTARNAALDIASGDYIAFVDSDDWIEKDMYMTLYTNAVKYQADISTCRNDTGDLSPTEKCYVFAQPGLMEEHLLGHCGTGQSPCDKLYVRRLFRDIRFPETRAYEDAATLYKVFALCQRLVHQDTVMYHYYRRENSTMTQPFSTIKYQLIDVYRDMLDFYSEKYPQYAIRVKTKLLGSIQYCIGETLKNGCKEKYRNEYNHTMNILREVNWKGCSKKHVLISIMMKDIPALYGLVYNWYH